jgi:alkanesulfonate monooxygenase SsuD/methylene tetrahydromethanopterin reductase-like flavin-dependent oxidoreductase (luciferase family)
MGLARFMFCAYATVPVYEKFFRWLGYGDAIDPMVEAWRGGDRPKALELAPADLIEDVFVLGEPAEQRERIEAYVDSGVKTPVLLIVPASGTPDGGYSELVESLAPS